MKWLALQFAGLVVLAGGFALITPAAGIIAFGVGVLTAGLVGELGAGPPSSPAPRGEEH